MTLKNRGVDELMCDESDEAQSSLIGVLRKIGEGFLVLASSLSLDRGSKLRGPPTIALIAPSEKVLAGIVNLEFWVRVLMPCRWTGPRRFSRIPHKATYILITIKSLHPCQNNNMMIGHPVKSRDDRRRAIFPLEQWFPTGSLWIPRSPQYYSAGSCKNKIDLGVPELCQRILTMV
ncbi:hypothetical protein TNCV_4056091 [Trichonephila clavipes]|nr:hypothetical protein TNCV_4056091 [Trichonephila clavipes]